jgi:hypothetical protein
MYAPLRFSEASHFRLVMTTLDDKALGSPGAFSVGGFKKVIAHRV